MIDFGNKIATRESYGNALAELGEKYPDFVVLDADLAGATKTNVFQKKFPDRHIDCGIAEANMTGIGAGIATTGKTAFISSFAMFVSGRNYEQVRNSVAYPRLNVKIGATHAGITVGEDGASHQCIEDLALMRVIPGMTVIVPSDDIEAKAAIEAAITTDGPFYLRFGRAAVPVINNNSDYKFEIGKAVTLRQGKDITIACTGVCVAQCLLVAEKLMDEGIDAEVINFHTIKPFDKEAIVKSAKKTNRVFSVEEHSIIGGLGGVVCESLADEYPTKVTRIGVKDVFGQSGDADTLLVKYELDSDGIYKQIKASL